MPDSLVYDGTYGLDSEFMVYVVGMMVVCSCVAWALEKVYEK